MIMMINDNVVMVDEGSPCDATTDRLSRIDKIVILWLLDND